MRKKSSSFVNFTSDAAKVLRAAAKNDRIICNVNGDASAIYVSTSHMIFKMNKWEYAEIAQPVTMSKPGDFSYTKRDGLRPEMKKTIIDIFDSAAKAADADEIKRSPVQIVDGEKKVSLTAFFNPARNESIFLNSAYADAAGSGCTSYMGSSSRAPIIFYHHSEPIAMVLPVNVKNQDAIDAAKAYFVKSGTVKQAEIEKQLMEARHAADDYRAKAETAEKLYRETAAELEAMKENASKAQTQAQPEAKTAAQIIAERFANMQGVTVAIKGAHTTAPVVWLSGDTAQHEEAIKASGGRWSEKRSAWYVKAA